MRRPAILLTTLALAFAACGGDDEPTPTTGTTGATGATGEAGSTSSGIATTGDFMDASIPEQGEAVQELVGSESACAGVDAKLGGDLQVGVAIAAASAEPDTPLAEIVSSECEEEG